MPASDLSDDSPSGQDRALPNERLLWLIQAIASQMGDHGLRLALRQADLARYIEKPPAANQMLGARSIEYSRLIDAVRTYFGISARGILIRIGREVFRQHQAAHPLRKLINRLQLFPLPMENKCLYTLRMVASTMSQPGDGVQMHQDDRDFMLVDRTYDRTLGVQSETPLCWTAIGEISEALLWSTRQELKVSEVDCRAMGADACRFEIQVEPQ